MSAITTSWWDSVPDCLSFLKDKQVVTETAIMKEWPDDLVVLNKWVRAKKHDTEDDDETVNDPGTVEEVTKFDNWVK